MISFFVKSLRNKLFITFVIIGFLPFLMLLVYSIFLSEAKIVNKIIIEQYDRVEDVVKLIDNRVSSLQKEVVFLSTLDVMDDILVDDIDKRVTRLLSQKALDLGDNITLMALNQEKQIVASSDIKRLLSRFDIPLRGQSGTYLKGKELYMYSQIFSTFDKTKALGYLILECNLDNLAVYLPHLKNIHTYIIDKTSQLTIGDLYNFNIDFEGDRASFINYKHVVVYKRLESVLKSFYMVYAVDKDIALEYLYDFIKFMLYVSLAILLLILYISKKFSKTIVKPVEDLTFIVENTIQTQNYSVTLTSTTKDEIAKLTNAFNKLLKTTDNALQKLEDESKHRLKRFIQLIDTFNTIIQTQTEAECLEVSMKQINILTEKTTIHFSKTRISDKRSIDLFITDFDKEQKIYFGSVILDEEIDDRYEREFYNSIAAMITLQLDRVRLIDKTMAASRAKSAFISNMSHELRTPLNAIIGFAQYLIAYEELSEDQQDTVSNIESSAQYLLGMINEILDIAKIEAGKMEAHVESVDIESLVRGSYEMLYPLATSKDLHFELITDNYVSDHYKTDPKMFKQIVINLVSNAIKFTQEGYVKITLFTQEEQIVLSVEDSGVGISSEDIKELFNDFTQVENVMQKKHKGTGLGLSLSRKMAHILNGDVILESEGLGKGTTSTFYIKIA